MTDTKKTGRGRKVGDQVPNAWVSGTDPVRHEQHIAWRQQKNQAQWRGEKWEIDFDDWILMWGMLWEHRGRTPEEYCMTRIDPEKDWVNENIRIMLRKDMFAEQSKNRLNKRWGKIVRSPEDQAKYEKVRDYQRQRRERIAQMIKDAKGDQ